MPEFVLRGAAVADIVILLGVAVLIERWEGRQ